MSLELVTAPVEGLTKVPVFERLLIQQAADGTMSVDGSYKVELRDADGNVLSTLPSVSFGMNQAQLMANPNFASTYPVLRALARSGLASVAPEFVSEI